MWNFEISASLLGVICEALFNYEKKSLNTWIEALKLINLKEMSTPENVPTTGVVKLYGLLL